MTRDNLIREASRDTVVGSVRHPLPLKGRFDARRSTTTKAPASKKGSFSKRGDQASKKKGKGRKAPFPFQEDAIKKIVHAFSEKGLRRGQAILPCGTGKTLTALWTAERLFAREMAAGGRPTMLLIVPSLQLLRQTLMEWQDASAQSFDYLCVCSEDDIDHRDEDDLLLDELFEAADTRRVTTDYAVVREFLEGGDKSLEVSRRARGGKGEDALGSHTGGLRVIFSTYQSLDAISSAQRFAKTRRPLDLVICDEAHKTAGRGALTSRGEASFTRIHDDSYILAARRLYMTATPRILPEHLRANGETAGVVDMSNERIFGPEIVRMGFSDAIALGRLCDYQIIGVGVSDKEVQKVLRSARGEDEWLVACAVAVAKVSLSDEHPISHGLSFHSSVAGAERFQALLDRVLKKYAKGTSVSVGHVNGTMTATERSHVLAEFSEKGGVNFITNARCLTEGVDVPAIDGVFFCDPKSSVVDIVQAVGRALRSSPGKKLGYIVVPIFHETKGSAASTIESSRFGTMVRVIRAMAAADSRLDDEIRVARAEANGVAGSRRGENTAGLHGSREACGAVAGGKVDVRSLDPSAGGRIKLEGLAEKVAGAVFSEIIGKERESSRSKKDAILQWPNVDRRPSPRSEDPKEKDLAVALANYLRKNSRAYDPDFEKKVRRAFPSWFKDSMAEKKDAILSWRDKTRRPSQHADDPDERSLGKALVKLLGRGGDPDFRKRLEEKFPAWFKDHVAEKKKAILAWKNPHQRPSEKATDQRERELGTALATYLREGRSSYDAEFERAVRRKFPLWF